MRLAVGLQATSWTKGGTKRGDDGKGGSGSEGGRGVYEPSWESRAYTVPTNAIT